MKFFAIDNILLFVYMLVFPTASFEDVNLANLDKH